MVTPPDPASFSASAVIFLEEAAAQIRVVTERTQWEDLLLNLLPHGAHLLTNLQNLAGKPLERDVLGDVSHHLDQCTSGLASTGSRRLLPTRLRLSFRNLATPLGREFRRSHPAGPCGPRAQAAGQASIQ